MRLWTLTAFICLSCGGALVAVGVAQAVDNSLGCEPHRWVVFQRRLGDRLSFAQNWGAYVKGFGNPRSNYWMGLKLLSEMTRGGFDPGCGLMVEVEDFDDRMYSAEFKQFKVLGKDQNYRLRLGRQVGSSKLGEDFIIHNNYPFSTFDRDNDFWSNGNCSQKFGGSGGWWLGVCQVVNLNSVYAGESKVADKNFYHASFWNGTFWAAVKRSVMKVKCD